MRCKICNRLLSDLEAVENYDTCFVCLDVIIDTIETYDTDPDPDERWEDNAPDDDEDRQGADNNVTEEEDSE